MAITLESIAQNAAADAVCALLDGGTIEFQTSGGVEVATVTFGTPAFGSAVAGTATANAISADTSATGGTTTKFVAKTSAGAAVFEGTVDTSGADIDLTSVVIAATERLEVDSFTYTQPAS
jgi:hypothetical protein